MLLSSSVCLFSQAHDHYFAYPVCSVGLLPPFYSVFGIQHVWDGVHLAIFSKTNFQWSNLRVFDKVKSEATLVWNKVQHCSNPTIPLINEKGYYHYDFITKTPANDDELQEMVELVAAWMTRPEQNKYCKVYQASVPVNVAPPTGPVKASRMTTARYTYSLLTKIFGEVNESTTNLELPILC